MSNSYERRRFDGAVLASIANRARTVGAKLSVSNVEAIIRHEFANAATDGKTVSEALDYVKGQLPRDSDVIPGVWELTSGVVVEGLFKTGWVMTIYAHGRTTATAQAED